MQTDEIIDILNMYKTGALVMMIGAPASGKSTLAKDIVNYCDNYTIVCPDDIRQEILGDVNDQSKNNEIFNVVYARINRYLKEYKNVVYDGTNCRLYHRKKAIQICKPYFKSLIGICMSTSLDECIDRNFKRDRNVPEDVIRTMHKSLHANPPKAYDGFEQILIF